MKPARQLAGVHCYGGGVEINGGLTMLCYLKSGPPLVTSSGYERLINILVDPVRLRVGPHHKISNLQCYRRTRLDYRRTPRKGWIPPHTGPSSKIAYLCRRSTTCLLEENDTKVTIPWYINVKYGVSVCVCVLSSRLFWAS